MYTRIKKSGRHEYLQICRSIRQGKKVKQQVVATIGRMDKLQEKDEIEGLVRSLAKYSEKVLLVLSGKSDPQALIYKIGPTLIFERLWEESGIKSVILNHLAGREFEFPVERALFLTVLHRLLVSGSDRFCNRWRRDYRINGIEELQLHHLYRAMGWLGEKLTGQKESTELAPRCVKDLIEESLFSKNRDLFSGLDLVFFDTTSIYFEGAGGDSLGQYGNSKDHRPDLKQMIVGVVLDNNGRPISCEMWEGNTADVTTLIPVIDRLRKRFCIRNFCIVADRGMISDDTIKAIEERELSYILGVRMRKVKDVRMLLENNQDISTYEEVYPERNDTTKAPAPLKVKEVKLEECRYVLCYNSRQARKDQVDRDAIISSLKEKIKSNAKSLIGNKGYRKYLKVDRETLEVNEKKIKSEAIFDGKWVLQTNINLSAKQIALRYKELWQVELVFRDTKSLLETRPIFHQRDHTIRGHVFCSFLALVLRKELAMRLENLGYEFEWAEIKQDLSSLQETELEDNGKKLVVRSECQGVCSKIFQAVGVAIPPTIREKK
jgi:transposase